MLKRVSIQNFKSLKDVTLDLQKVNLLIGPNNSGKTNFLKAFNFLYQYFDGNKNIADSAHYRKDIANRIGIHLIFEESNPEIIHESYRHILFQKTFDFKAREVYGIRFGWGKDWNLKNVDIQENDDPGIDLLIDYTGEIIVYRPDPNKLSNPGPVGVGKESVNADTSNLVGFLDLMLGKYRRTVFNQIETDLQKCIPEFSEVNLEDIPSSKELIKQFGETAFKRIGLTDRQQDVIYWANELSEGTLYFLALLCIINQPNPPKLLLLEEPERGIHPRRIREVMDFIFRLAEEKDIQIILTSHNEHVLDDFSTRPEAVFVFDKDEEGATYVRNLQTDIIEPTNKRNRELGLDEIDLTTNLSENWLYGLLGGVPSIP
ncbi:AAA family ATPase [Spirosoma sp. HMF3257]|uniref:Chromosome segregation protein SMC n=1 Tax=Spirosoma telluris TaxID=2183553 RepID=A0A327NMC7_9BACT|nr:AAA family ATPase [Spirosoma telluris]RAI75953.1 chromosome segregation protein SMC [Spirosoma telluris]